MELNIILITQARTGSTRLPAKVLKKINGVSLLETHLYRLKKCKKVTEIIVATTSNENDFQICDIAAKCGLNSFRGSEIDVLDRFYQSVKDKNADWIVRITSDCPLIDPNLVDKVISLAVKKNIDYCSNTLIERFPDGQDIEVFKFSVLKRAWQNSTLNSEREHVTPFIKKNSDFEGGKIFTALNYNCSSDFSKIRMTVDEKSDFLLVDKLIKNLGVEQSWETYTNYIIDNNLNNLNGGLIRNSGYIESLKKD